jgi:hypothetical protein
VLLGEHGLAHELVRLVILGGDGESDLDHECARFRRFQPGNQALVEPAQAAELKTALVGVALPAQRDELLEYAVQQRAEPPLLDGLRSLDPGRKYESLDDVVEELLRVQPVRLDGRNAPHEEAGLPPGGEDYTAA